jgi:hypothetical protein
MNNLTRDEHIAWCKKRALEYLDEGDIKNGVTSMLSDLSKHPETRELSEAGYAQIGMHMIMIGDMAAARRFVEGFQ